MRVLTGDRIARSIKECSPSRIAVAYLGNDWKDFIPDINKLEAVIISPKLGTNPYAARDLAERIGWNKLFFHNTLHAKLYLGNKSAVLGSANLSRNGLDGNELRELCFLVNSDAPEELTSLRIFFEETIKQAVLQYSTETEKRKRLSELAAEWNTAMVADLSPSHSSSAEDFREFQLLAPDHFYVLWYQTSNDDYDDSSVVEAIRESDDIKEEINFAESDHIVPGKWAIVWEITNNDRPSLRTNPRWMYIHEVFVGGYKAKRKDAVYTKLAIERKHLKRPGSPPFDLKQKGVRNALAKALQDDDLYPYFVQAEEPFSLEKACKGTALLVERMKQYFGESSETLTVAKMER